jgi:4-hydroxy-tetrahydrodipicolinate synthase
LDQSTEIVKGLGSDFTVLSGDDSLTLPIMSVGGKGVISVLANIAPKDVAEMCEALMRSDPARAQELHVKMYPLTKALFVETNPIPIKAAMAMMGLCSEDLRLPLFKAESATRDKLKKAMKEYGLL